MRRRSDGRVPLAIDGMDHLNLLCPIEHCMPQSDVIGPLLRCVWATQTKYATDQLRLAEQLLSRAEQAGRHGDANDFRIIIDYWQHRLSTLPWVAERVERESIEDQSMRPSTNK